MTFDYKTSRWKLDIDSFNRWKVLVEKLKDRDDAFAVNACERMRGYLRDIQKRWPQFIKEDEIP